MSTLCLSPLPATGFRSNVDWIQQEYHDTREGVFSNFDFVERKFGKKEYVNTIIRIFSLTRQLGLQFLLQEKLLDANALKQDEDDKVRKNDLDFDRSEIYRLSFFTCQIEHIPEQKDFLGYAVIKVDYYRNRQRPRIYVYESVLAPHRPANNCEQTKSPEHRTNFLHSKRAYNIENCFGAFSVTGAMYAQQNGRNFVCAHVALRSVLSLLNDNDVSYDEINQLAGNPLYSRNGLTADQIDAVLKAKGIVVRRISSKQFPAMGVSSFSPILYGYVESGCPSLLAFSLRVGVWHIVPVFGHTFDADSWVPESRNGYFAGNGGYFSSEGWLDSFLIHDDNFGPYQTLPRNYFEAEGGVILWGLHTDKAALCFERIETVALGVCWNFICNNAGQQQPNDWYNRLLHCANERKLVLRSLFTNKEHYIAHIKKNELEANYLELLQRHLPDKLWMVELSCRELFSATRAKFGEVLLTVRNLNNEFAGEYIPLALRLPGAIHFYPSIDSTHATVLSGRTPLFSQ